MESTLSKRSALVPPPGMVNVIVLLKSSGVTVIPVPATRLMLPSLLETPSTEDKIFGLLVTWLQGIGAYVISFVILPPEIYVIQLGFE